MSDGAPDCVLDGELMMVDVVQVGVTIVPDAVQVLVAALLLAVLNVDGGDVSDRETEALPDVEVDAVTERSICVDADEDAEYDGWADAADVIVTVSVVLERDCVFEGDADCDDDCDNVGVGGCAGVDVSEQLGTADCE